ncbi:hypothetical protein Hdeb2414_s0005g00187381 [Helianthus debilis subsp. tardiflorus]
MLMVWKIEFESLCVEYFLIVYAMHVRTAGVLRPIDSDLLSSFQGQQIQ